MSVEDQFKELARELQSRKAGVRHFAETKHHQTDGEWKESLLREVLQRHLPKNLEPVRGFVTNGEDSTSQIDVLLYDNGKPVRFRNGDVLFVTPDSAAGIIEVKSSIDSTAKLEQALMPLASNVELIRKAGNKSAFAGLFSFETRLEGYEKLRGILECLLKVSGGVEERVINLVALGDTVFVLNWDEPDSYGGENSRRRWYGYNLPEMAPGYFISNVVRSVAPDSVERYAGAWFPKVTPQEQLGLVHEEDLGFGVAVYRPVKWPTIY